MGDKENKLINLSYNIYKKYGHQDYIGARPSVELAFAGVATGAARLAPIAGVYLTKAIETANTILRSVKSAETVYNFHKLFLTSDNAKRYEDLHEETNELQSDNTNNIFEKRKAGDESKFRTKVKDTVGSTSASGMPDPDDEEPEEEKNERKTNCKKAESPIWKGLKKYKNGYKINGEDGRNRQYYEWDNSHKDIEVYDHKYDHKGSLDPQTGELYKPAVKGRKAWNLIGK